MYGEVLLQHTGSQNPPTTFGSFHRFLIPYNRYVIFCISIPNKKNSSTQHQFKKIQGQQMKFFNPDDSIVDVVSKITTSLFTIFTFIFGWYAYHHTIHPIFEKEKELQRMTQERRFLSKENSDLKEQNALYMDQNKKYASELPRLKNSFNNLSLEIGRKQQELSSINQKLEKTHKYVILSNLNIITGKLIEKYTLSIIANSSRDFDMIENSYKLMNEASLNNNLNVYEREAYTYFREYVTKNKGEILKSQKDKLHFALYLAFSYQKENSLF